MSILATMNDKCKYCYIVNMQKRYDIDVVSGSFELLYIQSTGLNRDFFFTDWGHAAMYPCSLATAIQATYITFNDSMNIGFICLHADPLNLTAFACC